jgi:Tol biopolymer transport system component
VEGDEQTLETDAATVRDLLEEANITLENLDHVTPAENTRIQSHMTITVTRVIQRFETITETLPFERRVVKDASIPQGKTRLLQAGQEGTRASVYRITIEDGVQVERALVREIIRDTPRDEILMIGTQTQIQPRPISGTLAYLNYQDAWLMQNSSSNRRRITSLGDLDERVFALSPDGTRLLFTRAVTEADHVNALWLVHTDQADAEPLDLQIHDILWADWSPNGERIAWTTAEPSERPSGWRGQNDLQTAILTPQDRLISRREVLPPEAGGGYGWWGTRYTWAPDSANLAYARPDEVGVVNVHNGKRQTLARFPAYRTYSTWAWHPHIAWSPDGGFISTVLHSTAPNRVDPEESPVFDLWTLEATGAYSAEIASEVGMWAAPTYAPSGETLLFGRARIPYQSQRSAYTLCTIDRDGSNRTCAYPPDEERGIERPVWGWSPDGEGIFFILQGDLHLYLPVEGTALRLTDEGGITQVVWK